MKFRSNIFRGPRSITDVDDIRIDWASALQEARKLTVLFDKGPFDKTLKTYRILSDIQTLYNVDDVNGYLDLLEKNRDILKNGAVHFKEDDSDE